jgi:hypothetical protein
MLEQLMDLLAHPDDYEVRWHDGELHLRYIVQPTASPLPIQMRELEPA